MRISSFIIVGSMMAATTTAASGATLISQPPQYDPYGSVSGQTPGTMIQSYDDFRLSAPASIDSVTWWGQPVSYDSPAPTHFTIAVVGGTADAIPDPNNVYFSENVTANGVGEPNEEPPEQYAIPGFFYAYKFSVNLDRPFTLPSDTDLYLTILNDDVLPDPDAWSWAASSTAASDPGAIDRACYSYGIDTGCSVATFNGQISDDGSGRGYNLAWELGGTQDVGAVPEPVSWVMMIAGLGLVGATMRYRRRSPLAGVRIRPVA